MSHDPSSRRGRSRPHRPASEGAAPPDAARRRVRLPPFLAIDATTRWPVLPDAPVTKIGLPKSIPTPKRLALDRAARFGLCCDATAWLAVAAKLSHGIARRCHGEETVNRFFQLECLRYGPAQAVCRFRDPRRMHRVRRARPGTSATLAFADGEDRRPLCRRRQFGCDGTCRRAAPHGTFRPIFHRGESRRRQWGVGRRHGCEVTGRRLHAALGGDAADDDRARDGQTQSRSDQGFRADQRGRDQRFRARGAQGFSAENAGGIHRLCEGAEGKDEPMPKAPPAA